MNKKKKLLILGAAICGCLLVFLWLILGNSQNSSTQAITQRDLSTIDGCPEYYELTWGMTTAEVTAAIQVENEYNEDMSQVISTYPFSLYGEDTKSVYCCIISDNLVKVELNFPIDATTKDDLADLITAIYGAPTAEYAWVGEKTTITIESTDMNVSVIYTRTANSQFHMFTAYESASAHDPYSLTAAGSFFGCQASPFIQDLIYELDYNVTDRYLYTIYTFYPEFEYMGMPAGRTSIELYTSAFDSLVNKASYLVEIDEPNAAQTKELISNIVESCSINYGAPEKVLMTIITPDSLDTSFITESELFDAVSTGEGDYTVIWYTYEYEIMLDIHLSADSDSSFARLTFTRR